MRMRSDMRAMTARIKQIDLRSALEFYGVRFNRQGAALCPFHQEKTPSFKVKNGWYHCFGCGESGDLIEFVRNRANCSFKDAVDRIASDFHLSAGRATLAQRLEASRSEARREARNLALRAAEDAYLDKLSAYLDRAEQTEKAKQADPLSKRTADAYWDELKAYAALLAADDIRKETNSCWQ